MISTANVGQPNTKKDAEAVVDSLKNLIVENDKKEKNLRVKLAEKKDHLKSELMQKVPYREADKKVKEFMKERRKERETYLHSPALAKLDAEIKEMTKELKETRQLQSEYALEYSRITQMSLFDLNDGREVYILKSAKVMVKMGKLSVRNSHK